MYHNSAGVIVSVHDNGITLPSLLTPADTLVWTHLAVSYNGTALSFYKGGALYGAFPHPTLAVPTEGAMGIGLEFDLCPWSGGLAGGDSSQFLDGAVDEYRIWTYQRTNAEIAANFDRAVSPRDPNLYAYWTFDAVLPPGVFEDISASPWDLYFHYLTPSDVVTSSLPAPFCPFVVTLDTQAAAHSPARTGARFDVTLTASLPLASPLLAGQLIVTNGVVLSIADLTGARTTYLIEVRATPAACAATTVAVAGGALTAASTGCLHVAASVVYSLTPTPVAWTDIGTTALVGSVTAGRLAVPPQPADITVTVSISGLSGSRLWVPEGSAGDGVAGAVSQTSVVLTLRAGQSFLPPIYVAHSNTGTANVAVSFSGLLDGAGVCVTPPPVLNIVVTAPSVASHAGSVLLIVGAPFRARLPLQSPPTLAETACALTPMDRLWADWIAADGAHWGASAVTVSAAEFVATPDLAQMFAVFVLADSVDAAPLAALTAALKTLAKPVIVAAHGYQVGMGLTAAAPVATADGHWAQNPPPAASTLALAVGGGGGAVVAACAPGALLADGTTAAGIRVSAGLAATGAVGTAAPSLAVRALLRTALSAAMPESVAVSLPAAAVVSPVTGRPTLSLMVAADGSLPALPAFAVALSPRYGGGGWARPDAAVQLSLVSADVSELRLRGQFFRDVPLFGVTAVTTVGGSASAGALRVGGAASAVRLVATVSGFAVPLGLSAAFDVALNLSLWTDANVALVLVGGSFPARLAAMRSDSREWRPLTGAVAAAVAPAPVTVLGTHCVPWARACTPRHSRILVGGITGGASPLLEADTVSGAVAYSSLNSSSVVWALSGETAAGAAAVVGDFAFNGSSLDLAVLRAPDGASWATTSLSTTVWPLAYGAAAAPDVALRATAIHRHDADGLVVFVAGGDGLLIAHSPNAPANGTVVLASDLAGVSAMASAEALGYTYIGRTSGAASVSLPQATNVTLLRMSRSARWDISAVPGAEFMASGAVLAAACTAPQQGADRIQQCWFGGTFTDGTGQGRSRLVSYDGSVFRPVGSAGIGASSVRAIAYDAASDWVYVAGDFTAGSIADCPACAYVARFRGDGSGTLQPPHLSALLPLGPVNALAIQYMAASKGRAVLSSAVPAALAVGDAITLTFAIPSPPRLAAASGGSVSVRLVARASSTGVALIAPSDFAVMRLDDARGTVSFVVRLVGAGSVSLGLEVHDPTASILGLASDLSLAVAPASPSSVRKLHALMLVNGPDTPAGIAATSGLFGRWEAAAASDVDVADALLSGGVSVHWAHGGTASAGVATDGVFDVIWVSDSLLSSAVIQGLRRARTTVVLCAAGGGAALGLTSDETAPLGLLSASAAAPNTVSIRVIANTTDLGACIDSAGELVGAPAATSRVRPLPTLSVVAVPVGARLGDAASIGSFASGAELCDCEVAAGPRVVLPFSLSALAPVLASPARRAIACIGPAVAAATPWVGAIAVSSPPPPSPPPSPPPVAGPVPTFGNGTGSPPPPSGRAALASGPTGNAFTNNLTEIGFVFGGILAVVLVVTMTVVARRLRRRRSRRVAQALEKERADPGSVTGETAATTAAAKPGFFGNVAAPVSANALRASPTLRSGVARGGSGSGTALDAGW